MADLRRFFGVGLLLVLFLLQSLPGFAQSTAAESLAEASKLYTAGNVPAAVRMLEKALDSALKEPNRQVEAEARYHLATALTARADYAASDAHLKVALPLFEEFGNVRLASACNVFLGQNALASGNTDAALQYFEKAQR